MPAKTPKPRTMRVWVVMPEDYDQSTKWVFAHLKKADAVEDAKWHTLTRDRKYIACPATVQLPASKVRR